jgi:FdhD protein
MQLRQPVQAATLVITSRCGSELIHKAVQFGAAHLISLASPASSRCDWP